MKSLDQRIREFHLLRQQPTLNLKYQLMADNPFAFYRATCHLFYEDLATHPALQIGPPVWVCGDLHIENFGSYRAANGLVYFDINDFDEGLLAPASWEIVRFLCSIGMAADLWKYSMGEAESLMLAALKAYTRQLAGGKAYAIERETSPPLIQDFFDLAEGHKEKELIKARVNKKAGTLKMIDGKTLPLAAPLRQSIKSNANEFFKEAYGYLKVKDVAFRIAGTGSLGLKRYVLLVEDQRQDKWLLLDVKQAMPSALAPFLKTKQPAWVTEAARVVEVQTLMQYALPRLIGTLPLGEETYVLKQLQPTSQKIDHSLCDRKMKNVETVMTTMAQALASAHLRSAARKGSADVESLMKFSLQSLWQAELVQTAITYVGTMKDYFRTFRDLMAGEGMRS